MSKSLECKSQTIILISNGKSEKHELNGNVSIATRSKHIILNNLNATIKEFIYRLHIINDLHPPFDSWKATLGSLTLSHLQATSFHYSAEDCIFSHRRLILALLDQNRAKSSYSRSPVACWVNMPSDWETLLAAWQGRRLYWLTLSIDLHTLLH